MSWILASAALCVFAAAAVAAPSSDRIPPPRPAKADTLVGAFYFPGWSQAERWYCMKANPDVQHPLLGYYREGDPAAAEWHIKWALEHGVGFFAFDYYSHFGSEMLETALADGFLKAPSIGKFRFCLNWCNHASPDAMTDEQFDRFVDLVVPRYLTHPSYLRIGGKPVVIILVGYAFVKTLGVERAKAAFARLDARCREAGLPGVHLIFCEGEILSEQAVRDSFSAGAQGFCLYNYPYYGTPFTGPGKHGDASYADLVKGAPGLWKHWEGITNGRFWPTVMPGWDRRPWTKDQDLIRTGSTPDLFERSLRDAKNHLNADRIALIEAWNEWGEGSHLEPSVEKRFQYLERVRKVFCPDAPPHTDATPKSLRLAAPVFDLRLPSTDRWTFDYNTEGWTGTALGELRTAWGALACKSQTGDPQLTSPVTYLPCADYPKARLRMRAGKVPGGPTSATGQLFWSTVDRSLAGTNSVTFSVPLDGQWHDYDIDLAGKAAWKGIADRFRLDPVDVPGVDLEIDGLWILKRGQ